MEDRTGDVYTTAARMTCARPACRTLDATLDAQAAVLAASTARVDRLTLGLRRAAVTQ